MIDKDLVYAIDIHAKKNIELFKYILRNSFQPYNCDSIQQKNEARFIAYKTLPPKNVKLLVVFLLLALLSVFKLPLIYCLVFVFFAGISLVPLLFRYWRSGIVAKNLEKGNYQAYMIPNVDSKAFYVNGMPSSYYGYGDSKSFFGIKIQQQLFLVNKVEYLGIYVNESAIVFVVPCGKTESFTIFSDIRLKHGIIPRYIADTYID